MQILRTHINKLLRFEFGYTFIDRKLRNDEGRIISKHLNNDGSLKNLKY